jgi:hypothetical protein
MSQMAWVTHKHSHHMYPLIKQPLLEERKTKDDGSIPTYGGGQSPLFANCLLLFGRVTN